MNKVFLGGTCNESTWRNKLIPLLAIDYFNPVVEDWTQECQQEEYRQKDLCDIHLYIITPKMTGVFSIAEAVDSSNKYPEKTLFIILEEEDDRHFTSGELRSLMAVGTMIEKNGGHFLYKPSFDAMSISINYWTDLFKTRQTALSDRYKWIPVNERLPKPPQYDWVLVRTLFNEGGRGVPHIAELRNGVWYTDCCDGPMEETLALKVTDWFDMGLILGDEQ